MKAIILLACVSVWFCLAGSSPLNEPIPIVSMESDAQEDGKFHYSYETGNGIKAHQEGELRVFDKENAGQVVHGEYSYDSPKGEKVLVSYIADENGYQASGSHIPVAPAIPDLILRSLDYISKHPYVENEEKQIKLKY